MNKIPARFSAYLSARDRGWMLSLFAAVCALYLPFLGNPFVFDDVPLMSGNFLEYYVHIPYKLDFRWFHFASMGWTREVFSDLFPHPFRLGNLLLHAANVILLFHVLRQLLGTVPLDQNRSTYIVWGAWFGALMFAVHPVAVYAAGYLVQRSILMATLFALLMQWAYLRALLSGRAKWLLLAVLAYFIACFSKEHSVMMPAVLAAMTLLLRKENLLSWRALVATWGAFLAIAMLVLLVTKGVLGAAYEPMVTEGFAQQNIVVSGAELHLHSIVTQAGLFFKYLLLWAVPNPAWMSIDMRESFTSSLSDWSGWLSAIGFVLYGLLALRLLWGSGIRGLVGLALLYPWLQFIVEFSSVRVQEPFVLYRSYLWMPGLMIFIPLLLIQFPHRRTLLLLAGAAVLLVPLSLNRLWVFGDNYRLWNDAALLLKNEQVPGADRIYYNRAQALMEQRNWAEAAVDLERTIAISPQLALPHYYLGFVYLNLNRFQEALDQFEAAIAINPNDGQEYFAKGFALKRLHRDKEALQQMELGCKLKNTSACMVVLMSEKGRNRK
jgi:tetratricopeptide (TPR) repeat protein